MNVEEFEIYQGDTGPILLARPGGLAVDEVLAAEWHCYTRVNDYDGTEVVAEREVTDKSDDNLTWLVAITPTESALLVLGADESDHTYTQIVEVRNATTTPPFNVEKHVSLKVFPQGIPPV